MKEEIDYQPNDRLDKEQKKREVADAKKVLAAYIEGNKPVKILGKEISNKKFTEITVAIILWGAIIIFFYLISFTDIIVERTKYTPLTQQEMEESYYRQQETEYNTPDCDDTRFFSC